MTCTISKTTLSKLEKAGGYWIKQIERQSWTNNRSLNTIRMNTFSWHTPLSVGVISYLYWEYTGQYWTCDANCPTVFYKLNERLRIEEELGNDKVSTGINLHLQMF